MKKVITLIAIAFLLVACKKEKSELKAQVFKGPAIGTTYSVKFYHDRSINMAKRIDALVDSFNKSMSTWWPNSDITAINKGVLSTPIDEAFQEVMDYARVVHKDTDGYFDPTVGNLVNAYGFGANGKKDFAPTPMQVDSLMNFVGFDKVKVVKDSTGAAFIDMPQGMYLEFNAIAKGTLVDYIAHVFDDNGVTDYIIDVGGEVFASGINQEKQQPWLVGVNAPKKDKTGSTLSLMAVELNDAAMAGSGNYRKFKLDPKSGQEYVHTVNPLTGMAVPSEVVAVNVIADNCTLADGYATAFMAMPLELSRQKIKEIEDIEVLIMYLDENGILQFLKSDGFDQYLKK